MRWPRWLRRDGKVAKAKAEQAQAKLREVKRLTPVYERIAQGVELPPEEFAARVAQAFRRPL